MPKRYNIRMWIFYQLPHDLKLPVFEAFVLEHLLDSYNLPSFHHLGFKDHPKGTVTNDTLRGIGYVLLCNSATTTIAAAVTFWICAHGGSGGCRK